MTRKAPRGSDSLRGSDEAIFVSIAAYRDPELAPTVEDCLAKARYPNRLRFGICWQHGSEDPPEQFSDSRFKVLDVDWRSSLGACWARAEIMRLWEGEEWFLQLDSHHRFVDDWDTKLMSQLRATQSPKPILTTYAAPYTPGDPTSLGHEPMRMEFDRFTDDGLVIFKPGVIPDWETNTAPRAARFVSAHFLFAPGSFVHEVPYDPNLYFIGEEITLAVRAFTQGYDLYHPGEAIVWHEYTRNNRPKHWDDHGDDKGGSVDWVRQDTRSRKSARNLLTGSFVGSPGIGSERSVADYEVFAGINFEHQRVQDYTRHHFEPPNPPIDDDWVERTRVHTVRIRFAASLLDASVVDDSQFWYVGVTDRDGQTIFRADADREEIRKLLTDCPDIVTLIREFESTAVPAAWEVRPYGDAIGWTDPIEGELVGYRLGQWGSDCFRLSTAVSPNHPIDDTCVGEDDWDLVNCFPQVASALTFTETEGGFVANKRGSPTVFVLNSTGALILELSNGHYSVAEIIAELQESFALPTPPRAAVESFLDAASRGGLVRLDRLALKG